METKAQRHQTTTVAVELDRKENHGCAATVTTWRLAPARLAILIAKGKACSAIRDPSKGTNNERYITGHSLTENRKKRLWVKEAFQIRLGSTDVFQMQLTRRHGT